MTVSIALFFKIRFGNFMLKVILRKIYLIWLAMFCLVLCICEVLGLKEKVLITFL